MRMHEAGIIKYAERRAAAKGNPCFIDGKMSALELQGPMTMSFIETSGAFIVLGIGIVLSLLAFAMEIVCGPRTPKRSPQVAAHFAE